MVIEPNLAERRDFRMPEKFLHPAQCALCHFAGIIRMYSDGRKDLIVRFGNAHGRFQVRRPVPGSDRQHVFQARGDCPLDNGFPVFGVLAVIQMTVRIDKFHALSFAIT
jgi:hypothetical protein